MSQEKIDKRKYEKYHRKEIQRKKRIKSLVTTIIFVLILGTAIGIPLGYKIYESMPKTISSTVLPAWVSNYVKDLDGYPFISAQETTSEEATAEDSSADSSTEDASGNTAETTEESVSTTEARDTTAE